MVPMGTIGAELCASPIVPAGTRERLCSAWSRMSAGCLTSSQSLGGSARGFGFRYVQCRTSPPRW